MSRYPLPLAAVLGLALILPACREEEPEAPWEPTPEEPSAPRLPEGDINAVNRRGMTALAELSNDYQMAWDDLQQALGDEDADMAAEYRRDVEALKGRIREHLRAGADIYARALAEDGRLAPCARQYWPQALVDELRAEGFDIPDTPSTPPAP